MRTSLSDMLQLVVKMAKKEPGDYKGLGVLHALLQQAKAYRTLAPLFLLCFLCSCNGNNTANSSAPVISNPPPTSIPMPPLNGKSLTNMGWSLADGKRNAFSDFNGKVLVLDFYATWCDPCRRSIPHLVELQKRYESDVRVIGLNVGGPDDDAEVPAFAREFQIQYQLGTPDDDLVNLLMSNSDAIPQTFVFDRHGNLLHNFVGYGETTGEEIDRVVESALNSKAD